METPQATNPGTGMGAEAFVVDAYEGHAAEVFGFLARATRDPAVAEDLVREAYSRLAGEARRGRFPPQVRGWLYRVATSLAIERFGRPTTARRATGSENPGQHDGGTSASSELERALDGLSPDARFALLLSGQGFGGAEIATAIGRSEAATRTLLSRARARLRIRRELFAGESG
jgi:RNA polymerase sigma-70 factor (ECF subfamily)